MTDYLLPTWLKAAKVGWRYIPSEGISRPEFGGPIRTAGLAGDRFGATLEFTPTATTSTDSAMERRALVGFLADLESKQNRAYLTDPSRRLGGTFPATELLSNNTFANGTTGLGSGAQFTQSVHDRVLRVMRNANTGGTAGILRLSSNPTVTQYAPHVLRAMVVAGRGTFADLALRFGSSAFGSEYASLTAQSPGLLTLAHVPYVTSLDASIVQAASTSAIAGEFVDVPWWSLSRCALVDNGANLLLQSDDFTTTWTNTRSTDAANSTAAPDGTTTADSIIEDATASSTHYVQQNVTVAATTNLDYAFSVCVKAGTRSFARIELLEGASNHECLVSVNLTTGALGTATASGANWANPRAFSTDMGNGWWRVTIVGRKVSASTLVGGLVILESALGTSSYTGDGASLIYAWRATLAQSSVPTRLVATTTAAVAASAQTGRAIYVKGLPASTSELLLPYDWIEIITSYGSEIHMVTRALNSDAAGGGYLFFKGALRGTLADNAPIIVHEPMGRCVFAGEAIGWDNEPGIVTRASAEFEEAA